jgi:hypothetical protein
LLLHLLNRQSCLRQLRQWQLPVARHERLPNEVATANPRRRMTVHLNDGNAQAVMNHAVKISLFDAD